MTKIRATTIVAGIIIAGSGVGLIVQYQLLTKLREDNRALREQAGQINTLAEENQRLSNLVASTSQRLPKEPFQELLRLRGEIGVLRKQASESEKLSAANHPLPTSSGLPVQSQSQLNSGFVSHDSLANVGYATPEAAVQTFCWAWAQGDKNAILASLSPEGRARLEKSWEGLSEAQIAEKLTGKGEGFRVVNQKEISADEILLSLYLPGEEETLAKMRMKRFGNEWKLAGD